MSNFNDEVCEYSYSSVTENFGNQSDESGYQSFESCVKECEKSHESQDVHACQSNCYRNYLQHRKPPVTAGNSGGGGTIHF